MSLLGGISPCGEVESTPPRKSWLECKGGKFEPFPRSKSSRTDLPLPAARRYITRIFGEDSRTAFSDIIHSFNWSVAYPDLTKDPTWWEVPVRCSGILGPACRGTSRCYPTRRSSFSVRNKWPGSFRSSRGDRHPKTIQEISSLVNIIRLNE